MSVWASFLVSRPSLSAGCPHTHLFNLNAQNAHPGTRHTQECKYMHVIVGLNNTWGPAGQEVPSTLPAQVFHPGGDADPFPSGRGSGHGASTKRQRPQQLCLGSRPSRVEALFPSDLWLPMPGPVGLPGCRKAREPSGPVEAITDPFWQVSWGVNLIPAIRA